MVDGNGSAWGTLAKGVAAGVAATGALVATRNALYAAEDDAVKRREEAVRGKNQATGLQVPVRKASAAAGVDLGEEREAKVATALAWGLGVAGVVAYAFARERWLWARRGSGALFGLGVWALEDELAFPLLGFAEGPTQYPWQAHARGFGAHLAYGLTAERSLALLDRAA